jgi:hypothetical protein
MENSKTDILFKHHEEVKAVDRMTVLHIQFHCDIYIYLLYTLVEGKIRHCVAVQSGCAKEKLCVFRFFITCKEQSCS